MSLRNLRADKLFLTASGITPGFGLSHANLAEVAIKQAMIRAACDVILLADHTKLGQESMAQIAPCSRQPGHLRQRAPRGDPAGIEQIGN